MTRLKCLLLAGVLALGACTNSNTSTNTKATEQELLKEVVVNSMGSYTIAAEAMLPFIDGDIPGVKLTLKEKELIQAASSTVYSNLDVLNVAIQNKQPLSEVAVESAVVQLKMLNACWFQLKNNSHNTVMCNAIISPTSNTTENKGVKK